MAQKAAGGIAEAIYDAFLSDGSSLYKHHEIVASALEGLCRLQGVEFASFFSLSDESYEFSHGRTSPESATESGKALFAGLLDSGIIGSALEKGAPGIEEDSKGYAIALPLRASWGIQAILLMSGIGNSAPSAGLISRIAPVLASRLEAALLRSRLKKTREVLEQKVAARTMELANNQRKFRAILDSVHTAIMIINNENNLIEIANPVAVELIGDEEKNIIGKDVFIFLKDKFDSESNFESELRSADGGLIPIIRTISYLNLGQDRYRIESFFDITEQKRAEKALRDTNELLEMKVEERTLDLQLLVHKLKSEVAERENAERELQKLLDREKELNELKTRFVTMVSHEFRTPLTIIRSSAQMTDRFGPNMSADEKHDSLNRIIKTVDVMTDLIENVIFIGKNDSVGKGPNIEIVDLPELCQNIIKDLQLALNRQRDVRFAFYGECEETATDHKLFRLIMSNLVSNALKYSPDNSIVEVELVCIGDQIVLSVKDQGIGIPENEQAKIFELFYRGRNVSSYSGTGLGMSVALESVELLGGRIDISSKENAGTTFRVALPINQGGDS
ncbi:MAG: ATP-binding protein [Bacteroidota bacterium]